MRLPTWGWTDRHLAVAALVALAMAGSLVGLGEGTPVAQWVAAALAVSALLALASDAWGGALIGLAASAVVVLARKQSDLWSSSVFVAALVETVVIVAVGLVAGHTGARLRQRGPSQAVTPSDVADYEALGLLSSAGALARLREEMTRTQRVSRPLQVALFAIDLKDSTMPIAGRTAALRSVARVVESRTPELDVPFALARDRVGIIFPDSAGITAWDTVSRVLEAVGTAHFSFGSERQPRRLDDAVDLFVGLASRTSATQTAEALLDAATAALDRARLEEDALR